MEILDKGKPAALEHRSGFRLTPDCSSTWQREPQFRPASTKEKTAARTRDRL